VLVFKIRNGENMKKGLVVLLLSLSLSVLSWELEDKNYQFEKITDNVFVMHGPLEEPNEKNEGFMNNPALIIGDTGLIVIDPGSNFHVGKKVIQEIEKISKKPILAVFNSHIHGDHWLGNQAIVAKYPKVKIYAHPKMIEQAKGEKGSDWVSLVKKLSKGFADDTVVTPPTDETKNQQIIVVDGQKFKIHNPTLKAHTDTDIMIEHLNSHTLFLGDNDFVNRMGRFDASSNMHGNIEVLQYAKKLNIKYFVPGHGPTGNLKTALEPFLNYLLTLQKVVKKGYEAELEDYEIRPKVLSALEKYKKWSGFESNLGAQINKIYLEIENLDE
jgi:glyoxylase-like metal-dependent hydrolase (beta-lactamase superfamily II)